MKYLYKSNSQSRKADWWLPLDREREKQGATVMGVRLSLGELKMFGDYVVSIIRRMKGWREGVREVTSDMT